MVSEKLTEFVLNNRKNETIVNLIVLHLKNKLYDEEFNHLLEMIISTEDELKEYIISLDDIDENKIINYLNKDHKEVKLESIERIDHIVCTIKVNFAHKQIQYYDNSECKGNWSSYKHDNYIHEKLSEDWLHSWTEISYNHENILKDIKDDDIIL